MRNNHGGGYQYRIAPLPSGNFAALKESDFKPLDFVQDEQSIVFPNGTTLKLTESQTTFISEGTLPVGGTWSMIPMPPTLLGNDAVLLLLRRYCFDRPFCLAAYCLAMVLHLFFSSSR
jgi:hypothetical protein